MAAPLDIVLRLSGMEAVQQGFDKTLKSLQGFGDKLTSVGKTMSLAVTAPIVGFAALGIAELSSVQAAMAQTEAAIKSTGGVAGISAKGVRELSESLQGKSAVDAEVIQSGANLLLTFTNIRNVAGKNNDIFNQASMVMLDFAQATGRDVPSAATMLGKALQDPIRGITALGKAGATFTEAQKDQIKALVESGKTIEAQRMILAELTKEYGGSAEAYSKTLGGSLKLMKIQIDDVAGAFVQTLVPALMKTLAVASEWLTWFNSLDESTKSMIATIGVLAATVGPLLLVVGEGIKIFGMLAGALKIAIGLIGTALPIAIKHLGATLSFVMNMNPYILAIGLLIGAGVLLYTNWDTVASVAKTVWNHIKQTVLIAIELMLEALNAFTGWIPGWGTMIGKAAESVTAMRISVEKDMAAIQKPMVDTSKEVAKTGEQFKDLATAVPPGIKSVTKVVTEMGSAIEKRVIPQFFNLADVQRDMALKDLPKLKSSFVTLKDQGLTPAEKAFGNIGITTSLVGGKHFPELSAASSKMTTDLNKDVKEVITTQSLYEKAVQGVAESVKGIWNGTTTTFKDVWHGALDTFVDVFAQMVIQAQATGVAISVSMAAATVGISLVIGLFAMALGGKKNKIEIVPLTTRLKEVFDDFVSKFKSTIGDFKDILFPPKEAASTLMTFFENAKGAFELATKLRDMPGYDRGKGNIVQESQTHRVRNELNAVLSQIGVGGVGTKSVWWDYRMRDVIKISAIDDAIVGIAKKIGDQSVEFTNLMYERFNKIKGIVGDILGLYQKQKDFTKDMNKSITDVRRSLFTPEQTFTAQLGDIDALKKAVAGAVGDEQISLVGELKTAYLSAWESARGLFGEDTAKLIGWQKFTVDGLESVKQTGKTAYDKLIDVNLEMLGVQRDGRGIQAQMNSYLSSLDSTILKSLEAIKDVGTSGKINEQQLGYIASAFSQLFDIPKMAHGGMISKPTLAMIGEAGPEAVVPLTKPGRASQIMQEAGLVGGGGVVVNQNFRGPVIFDKISMSKWAREQSKLMKREMMRYA